MYHKVSTITTTDEVVATRFPFYFSQTACIIGFTVLIIATIIISLARSFLFFIMCLRSSTRLHNEMFQSISRTVLRFFHTNPSGKYLPTFFCFSICNHHRWSNLPPPLPSIISSISFCHFGKKLVYGYGKLKKYILWKNIMHIFFNKHRKWDLDKITLGEEKLRHFKDLNSLKTEHNLQLKRKWTE